MPGTADALSSGEPPLIGRLRNWRDGLLANPEFQQWASGFPLTRWVARRQAAKLFDLCAGFVYSRVLKACLQLRLLEALQEAPRSLASLASLTGIPEDSLRILLDAARALELIEQRKDDCYGLASLGASLVGNRGILAMITHHDLFYEDLRDPVALLRGEQENTALKTYWAYSRNTSPSALKSSSLDDYSRLMAESQPMIAGEVMRAYDFSRHHLLLDVGGGEGVFSAAVAKANPALRCVIFDLPGVAARAEARLAKGRLADRITAVGGDFFRDPLPTGADIVTLVRVLHDHDDTEVLALLRNLRRGVPSGTPLLVAEPMSGEGATGRLSDAYLAFYLLAMGQGRPRTDEHLTELLVASGFGHARALKVGVPMLTSVVLAQAV
jgi:demethylspheroidene O-methyltransferase